MAGMTSARLGLAVGEWNGHLVCIGGVDETGRALKSVERLDIGQNKWFAMPGNPHRFTAYRPAVAA